MCDLLIMFLLESKLSPIKARIKQRVHNLAKKIRKQKLKLLNSARKCKPIFVMEHLAYTFQTLPDLRSGFYFTYILQILP